jgi:hypothetical protein
MVKNFRVHWIGSDFVCVGVTRGNFTREYTGKSIGEVYREMHPDDREAFTTFTKLMLDANVNPEQPRLM